jgi:hypothetical protein
MKAVYTIAALFFLATGTFAQQTKTIKGHENNPYYSNTFKCIKCRVEKDPAGSFIRHCEGAGNRTGFYR